MSAPIGFEEWLAEMLPVLPVILRIPSSAKVSKSLSVSVTGVEDVLRHYRWKAKLPGADGQSRSSEDWQTTKTLLKTLGEELQSAGRSGSDSAALAVCHSIFRWGGERNPKEGARPFLKELEQSGQLISYLDHTRKAFDLNTGNEAKLKASVKRMTSMLTKVHALYAHDGLPIYDSRVAAAISSLAELYRRTVLQGGRLPEELRFPSVGGSNTRRRVRRIFVDADEPSPIHYGMANSASRWSAAQWRLGRLLKKVLLLKPQLFDVEGTIPDRMHALEAALFMIGYDVANLDVSRFVSLSK